MQKHYQKKCDDCNGYLEFEKSNENFLVYKCLKSEKCHQIEFKLKERNNFDNTFKSFNFLS